MKSPAVGCPRSDPRSSVAARGGKMMLAMEFFVHGATQFGEPDVFMMFEENAAELTANVRSLGFDLEKLVAQKKIVLDHVHIERSEIEKTDEYDLEGLFIRLWHSIESIGTNEYPFLIGARGLSVLPITSPWRDHQTLNRASFYRRERRLSVARFRNRGAMGLIPGHTAPSNVIFSPPGDL